MPGIAANADKRVNSYPCSDAHERASRGVGCLADVTGITSCTQKLVELLFIFNPPFEKIRLLQVA